MLRVVHFARIPPNVVVNGGGLGSLAGTVLLAVKVDVDNFVSSTS
jgi:hypothetical protein